MNFTDIFIRRPVLAWVVNILIVLGGFQALRNLNVRQYPKSDISVIKVTTAYYGADADPKIVPKFPNADPDPNLTEKRTPLAATQGKDYGEGSKLIPVQVVREKPIHTGTQQRNRQFQALAGVAGTVWANYQLAVTQFPTRPHDDSTDADAPFPASGGEVLHVTTAAGGEERRTPMQVNIANTTMETYFQSVSCMECHGKAGRYGVDYIYSFGRKFPTEPNRERTLAAVRVLYRPGWEIARNEPREVQDTIDQYKTRDDVSALDRRSLTSAFGKLSLPPVQTDPQRFRGSILMRKAAAAAMLDKAPPPEDDFKKIHDMFSNLIRAWANQKGENCPPEIEKRHGKAFGWKGGRPWNSWRELEDARFNPTDRPNEGLKLIDPKARTVSEMLLIKVLRGEQVEAAKNKQMPLNGPYLKPSEIDWLVERIAEQIDYFTQDLALRNLLARMYSAQEDAFVLGAQPLVADEQRRPADLGRRRVRQ